MDFEEICRIAGVRRKKTDRGIEIYNGSKKVGTFCVEDGVTRFKYPRGHEYKHTSYWGRGLDDNLILETMVGIAIGNIRDAKERAFRWPRS